MEPIESPKGARESSFRLLYGAGTAAFLFGILMSQTKGDRTLPLLVFVTAAGLQIAALLVGQLRRRTTGGASEWMSGPVSTAVLAIELLWSLAVIADWVTYELHQH